MPVTVIATKVDKLKPNELERSLRDLNSGFDLPDSQPIPFSAETGFGKKEVWRTIKSSILDDLSGEDESDEDDDEEYIEDVLDRKE